MSLCSFSNVRISGISTVVPENEICIYDEKEYYNDSIKKIDRLRKMVGCFKRRVVDEKTTASDLSICAAENLISEMQLDRNSLDALVFVVQKPDYNAPATAYYIHNKLGLSVNTPAFDINNGCSGFVYGMWIASQMISSGACKKILLLCADTPSKVIDLADRNLAPIFGDGGVAALLEYSNEKVMSYFNIETRSEGFESIISPLSGYRFNLNLKKDSDFELVQKLREIVIETKEGRMTSLFDDYLNGMEVFDFTMNVVPENIKTLLQYAQKSFDEINFYCLHQANKQIVDAIAQTLNLPGEKVPTFAFENFGNNTMCSIPSTICSVLKEKTEKDRVDILASGFGNGLTVASCIFSLEKIYNTGVKTYVQGSSVKSREDFIDYWINKKRG